MPRSLLALSTLCVLFGCGSSGSGSGAGPTQTGPCTPFTTAPCACPNGAQAQGTCNADGKSVTCQCPSSGGMGGASPFGGSSPGGLPQGGVSGFPQGGVSGFPQGGVSGFPQGGVSGFPQGGLPQGGVSGFPQGGASGVPQGGVAGVPQGGSGGVGGGVGGTPQGGTGGVSTAVDCTGKPGSHKGSSNQTVTAAGVQRTFVLYEPQTLDPNKAVPLVFVFHGFTMSGAQMQTITNYDQIADREGFVVAYPNGEGSSPWNVGQGVCPPGNAVAATGDDNSFIDAMKTFIGDDQCLDTKHIFATGFSMGGYFSHQIGCTRPDIAAVGPHSGGTHPFTDCTTGHKPVIIFHGTADPLIPISCDDTSRQQWVQKNGCGTGVDTTGGPVLGPMLKKPNEVCEFSQGCPADGQVVYCKFGASAQSGMGHAWAGGAAGQAFSDANYDSAAELGWAFFKHYAW